MVAERTVQSATLEEQLAVETMEQRLMEQVRVLSDELGTVKTELINMKAAHAALHQTTVESSARIERVARGHTHLKFIQYG